jgi:hypothetical protein
MKKTSLFTLSLLITFNIFISGAGEKIKTFELGNSASVKKVLIATTHSGFKDAVLEKATAALQKENCYLKIIALNDLEKEDFASYKAIVVVNTLKIGSLESPAKRVLKKADLTRRLVLFTTVGDAGWKKTLAEKYDVATVTSASDMGKTELVAKELVAKVKELL